MATTSTALPTSTTPRYHWQVIAKRKQDARSHLLPKEWLIPQAALESYTSSPTANVINVPIECGILTARELEITGTHDAVSLLDMLRKGPVERGYTAEEVVTAFCKRAAVAQQVVRTSPTPSSSILVYDCCSLPNADKLHNGNLLHVCHPACPTA
jgi:amidase